VSLRGQTCVGAAAWTGATGEPRVIQVWLDYRVARPRDVYGHLTGLPAELRDAVLDEARRLLSDTPGLDRPARRLELNQVVLAATQARAQQLGAELTSVVITLGNAPRPALPPPVFDLTGLPPLPRVAGWRS
jgi:hypothetical protein